MIMNTNTHVYIASACMLTFMGLSASATTTLTVGGGASSIELNPNQAGQTVNLFLSSDSGQLLGGGNIVATIGAGGPTVGFAGIGGTVLDGGFALPDADGSPLVLDVGLLGPSLSPTIDNSGTQLLGTLTLDTTGLNSGSFSLDLSSTLLNDDGAQPITYSLDGATAVSIVPEPTSLALLGLCGLMLVRRR